MHKITPWLWFDNQAEEAASFYTSIFKDSRTTDVTRYGEAGPGTPGTAMTVSYELAGQPFVALNGGPAFTFTEAISFQVACADQDEVDELWARLLDGGGTESQCGWLKDKFGVSWQIVPAGLQELIGDPDQGRAGRAMRSMLAMRKLDINEMRRAADGPGNDEH